MRKKKIKKMMKRRGFFLLLFLFVMDRVLLVSAENATSKLSREAYREFLKEYISSEAYYAIENVGENHTPILLIGKEGMTEENGKIMFTECETYYYADGQVIEGGIIQSVFVPLSIAQKDEQSYVRTSHNAHSVCFSVFKGKSWYFYEYDNNDALKEGVIQQEDGEYYACQKQFQRYIAEYSDSGSICFQKNEVSDFHSEEYSKTSIEEYMETVLSICEKGTFTTVMSEMQGDWCQQTGVISSWWSDFNRDGQEECLIVYLKEEDILNGTQQVLCLAMVTVDENGEIRWWDNTIVGIDSSPANDTRVYVSEGKEKNYIIVQSIRSSNGISDNIYIFSVAPDGSLYFEDWIMDPGYTPGMSLCKRYPVEAAGNDFWRIDQNNWKTMLLYESEKEMDCAENVSYGRCLNEILELYGLHASVSETMSGEKLWVLDEQEKVWKISQIYCQVGRHAECYEYDYGILDCTDMDDVQRNYEPDEMEIIPDSDTRYLSNVELVDMPLQVLNYAKNEIYARKGRKFRAVELQQYFDSKSWYHGTIEPDDFNEELLNECEQANAQLLSRREHELNPEGYHLDQTGYSFDIIYNYISSRG